MPAGELEAGLGLFAVKGDGQTAVAVVPPDRQRAALDALSAARAMIDAAEAMVGDPAVVESVLGSVTDLARQAAETVGGFAAGAARAARPTSADDGDGEGDGFHTIVVD